MHAIDPTIVMALIAASATVLMVQAGVAKRIFSWRPVERRPRRPRSGRR
jgi:hypothetical protein